jgi:hypothetical protein
MLLALAAPAGAAPSDAQRLADRHAPVLELKQQDRPAVRRRRRSRWPRRPRRARPRATSAQLVVGAANWPFVAFRGGAGAG